MMHLAGLADWLHGCSHRRTTFPITLRTSASDDRRQSAQSETYIVCLACGRHFAYDWSTMRINRHRLGWAHKRSSGITATEILHEQRL
jgi:hypothetical protein